MRSALLRLAWTILVLVLCFYAFGVYITTLRDLGVARAERDEARNLLATFQEQRESRLEARMRRMETALANMPAVVVQVPEGGSLSETMTGWETKTDYSHFPLPVALPEPELEPEKEEEE